MRRLFTLIGTAAIASTAMATTLIHRELGELLETADGIVLGRVTKVDAGNDKYGNIYTFVTLDNLKVAVGSYLGDTLTLQLEGGTVGNETVEVEGSPQFAREEQVILLVEGNGQRIVPIAGWGQGVFRIVRDPETGEEFVSDNVGNRILDVQDGKVIKENRVASQVELLVAGESRPSDSDLPAGSFGRTETGEEVVMDRDSMLVARPDPRQEPASGEKGPGAPKQKAMTAEAFLKAVQELAERQGMKGRELRSIEIHQLVPGQADDAQAQSVEEGKGPAEQSERGQRPQPIEIETEVSPDPPPEEPPGNSGPSN